MIPRSPSDWAFSLATVSTASPRSRIEFCQASASSSVLETTYLVVAFMRAVNGLPSVRFAHAASHLPAHHLVVVPPAPAAVREAAAGVLVHAAEALHDAVEGHPHRDR